MRPGGTVPGMTQQPESRWSLNSTGNRVLLAVVVALVAFLCAGGAGMHGAARVVVFLLVAAIAYGLTTVLRRR